MLDSKKINPIQYADIEHVMYNKIRKVRHWNSFDFEQIINKIHLSSSSRYITLFQIVFFFYSRQFGIFSTRITFLVIFRLFSMFGVMEKWRNFQCVFFHSYHNEKCWKIKGKTHQDFSLFLEIPSLPFASLFGVCFLHRLQDTGYKQTFIKLLSLMLPVYFSFAISFFRSHSLLFFNRRSATRRKNISFFKWFVCYACTRARIHRKTRTDGNKKRMDVEAMWREIRIETMNMKGSEKLQEIKPRAKTENVCAQKINDAL